MPAERSRAKAAAPRAPRAPTQVPARAAPRAVAGRKPVRRAASPPADAPGAPLRELVYRLAGASSRLSLHLSEAAPAAAIETTVTHLDDKGQVWRTLTVTGTPDEVAAVRAAFAAYEAPFLVEKEVLGATPRRLVLWYKYKPAKVPGLSHTGLAFDLLGRDTVITDRAQAGQLTVRVLARGGARLQAFLRRVRKAGGVEVLYLGPPRQQAFARLTDAEEATVRAAWRLGYFEVPGRADVREVAAAAHVSASTASYRLRRAVAKLVAVHLDEAPPG